MLIFDPASRVWIIPALVAGALDLTETESGVVAQPTRGMSVHEIAAAPGRMTVPKICRHSSRQSAILPSPLPGLLRKDNRSLARKRA